MVTSESCCGSEQQDSSVTSFKRIERLLDRYFQYRSSLCIERAITYTNVYKETEGKEAITRRAMAFKKYCEEREIKILADELIVGGAASKPRAAVFCPEHASSWLEEEIDELETRHQDPYDVTDEQKKILKEQIFPYWKGKTVSAHWLNQIPEGVKEIAVKTGIIDVEIKTQSAPGEISPYEELVLEKGFIGIKNEVENKKSELDTSNSNDYDKIMFYEAVLLCIDGIIILANRYGNHAERLSQEEKDLDRKKELLEITRICKKVPENPPETFWEALQAMWFVQIGCYIEGNGPSYSPGRVDQLLYKFYKKDIEQNRATDDDILELIECSYLKFAENTWFLSKNAAMYFAGYQPYQNICVGGITKSGIDATNELSYMFLKAKMEVRLHSPSLSVRVHKQSPEAFLLSVARLTQIGTGFPAIHNDETTIKMMLLSGANIEDARNYCMVGCVEPYIPGKMSKWTDGGHYNFASAIEFALTNGVSIINDKKKLGVSTGDPKNFTFNELLEAVKKQLAYFIKNIATACHITERLHDELTPYPFMSSIIDGCVEKGKDITRGGATYTVGAAFIGTGIADLANSLAAVRKFVYEDKILSMTQLVDAIYNNFEGYENFRTLIENKCPTYGNDIDYVDDFAREMTDFIYQEISKYDSYRGPKYISGLYPVASHVPHGLVVAALPYGRLAITPLADGCSPKGGTDINGPTAVLKSVSKINHDSHIAGTLLNMRLDPVTTKGDEGAKRIASLIRSFVDLNIYHLQFNMISSKVLLEAQNNPEKFRSLIVRVAGYSAYFVELCKEMQDDIIQRTVHKV